MARRRRTDGPDGILLVDKPVGPTSFDIIAKLRRALGTRSLGHTGTLDPAASGLLVVLAGRYTRLSAHLTRDDKRYLATIAFGTGTTTDDREGEVVDRGDPSGLTKEAIREVLAGKLGTQEQRPPAYSAVSVDGERLYMKARRGEIVEAPLRTITLMELELLEWSPPHAIVDVACSKGTYIRSIARDIGEALGVPAHLGGLRRTLAGAYSIEEAMTLDELLEPEVALAQLRVGPDAIRGLLRVEVDEHAAARLRQGQRPEAGQELPEGQVGLATLGEELVALVERKGTVLHVVRGFG